MNSASPRSATTASRTFRPRPFRNRMLLASASTLTTRPVRQLLSFASGMTTGFNSNGPTSLVDNTYVWSDSLTFIRGKHNFKTGFSYTPFQDNTAYDFYVNGEFYFYGTGGGSYSQNDHADFLMGLPDEFFQSPRAPEQHPHLSVVRVFSG